MEVDVELFQPLQVALRKTVRQPPNEGIVDPCAQDRLSWGCTCSEAENQGAHLP